MKILWISTSPIGPASEILKMPYAGTSGGWIKAAYDAFMKTNNGIDELSFLCSSKKVKKGHVLSRENELGKAYCLNLPKIPFGKMPNGRTKKLWSKVIASINPDVIHIWGTETVTQYLGATCSADIPKVLFLQGNIGIHSRYREGYLNTKADKRYYGMIGKIKRIRGKVKWRYFKRQVSFENEILLACKNIMTDNEWSKAYCTSISPHLNFFENHIQLNQRFQTTVWDYDSCEKNTIFTIFGNNANKGIHQLLRAILIVRETIPDVKVIIPGSFNSIGQKRMKKTLKMLPYEIWLENFILKNNLQKNIVFAGRLSVDEMVSQLKKCNVFVNPSCMETHASSLREAMIMGVPCITSLCGTVTEFVTHNCNGLIYRYEEYENLAYYIKNLLQDSKGARQLGESARKELLNMKERKTAIPLEDVYSTVAVGSKNLC